MSGAGANRLWAPWRMEYILAAEASVPKASKSRGRSAARRPQRAGGADEECLFCRVRAERGARNERENLVLARRPGAFLMLNRFPYNPGHLMVAVARHAAQFGELAEEERSDLFDLTALAERALAAEYRPHGLNYGANVGRVAGAGFPGHLHLHLVPRWNGDTNFMPTIGETKVLPESLASTWKRLGRAIASFEVGRAPTRGRR